MRDFLLVGSGGFLGSVSRYYLGGWVLHMYPLGKFPISTLVVNLAGCLLIGVIAAMAHHWHFFSNPARLFLMTGVLGGFTTFSAFGFETFYLMRQGETILAAINIMLCPIAGVLMVWFGDKVISSL